MDSVVVAGVDVGGTRIKSCLVDAAGTVVAERVRATPAGDRVVAAILDEVDVLSRVAPPAALGVAVPGLVDEAAGVARYSANLGWRELPILAELRAGTSVPVRLGHDVRAGLLAEARWGAARGSDDAIFLPLGTGLAIAVLAGGRPVTAPLSGEIGHVVVDAAGPACGCGRRGCLETIGSARSMVRAASEALGRGVEGPELVTLVRAGDEVANAVWDHALTTLATALAPVIASLGTTRLIIGGGIVAAGDVLLDPIHRALTARLPQGHDCAVVAATLGDRAGALGAACLGLDA